VRMRAWGVLLGIVTSTVALGVALLSTDVFAAVGLALAAVPGLVLASPLVAARLRKPAPAAAIPGGVRLAADVHVEADVDAGPPVFARIAAPAEAEVAPLLPASVTRRT